MPDVSGAALAATAATLGDELKNLSDEDLASIYTLAPPETVSSVHEGDRSNATLKSDLYAAAERRIAVWLAQHAPAVLAARYNAG
ncbi:hypothetical protein H9P43_002972 [Blastocladiella emersonii ATCC 22665]|nr:hypothetical protein H9P43_002972 [Blastocladiella emersonii ATCC 22665]